MEAVVVSKEEELKLVSNHPVPLRGDGEALVRILRAGICNTDLEIIKGYAGYEGVLGHEFLGRVEEVDANNHVKVGDRVVGEISLPGQNCTCSACQEGGVRKRNHCETRTVIGILNKQGTFARFLTIPVENLYVVPEGISDERAAFTEPLAAGFRIVEQNVIKSSDHVALIGDGKLGLLCAMAILHQPIKSFTIFGRHADKMALLPGENHKVIVMENDQSYEHFENKFDVCVEVSGTPDGLLFAAEITRPLGTIVLKSTCASGVRQFNSAPFVVKELKVIGSRCGNFQMALNALKTEEFPVENLISKVYPFKEALAALEHAKTRGTLKIQMIMDK